MVELRLEWKTRLLLRLRLNNAASWGSVFCFFSSPKIIILAAVGLHALAKVVVSAKSTIDLSSFAALPPSFLHQSLPPAFPPVKTLLPISGNHSGLQWWEGRREKEEEEESREVAI